MLRPVCASVIVDRQLVGIRNHAEDKAAMNCHLMLQRNWPVYSNDNDVEHVCCCLSITNSGTRHASRIFDKTTLCLTSAIVRRVLCACGRALE
jgi:hypothetical protein